jgi:hypothetical protein
METTSPGQSALDSSLAAFQAEGTIVPMRRSRRLKATPPAAAALRFLRPQYRWSSRDDGASSVA